MKAKLLVLGTTCIILLAANLQTSFAGKRGAQVSYQFTSKNVNGKETEAYGMNQGGDIVGRFVSSKSLLARERDRCGRGEGHDIGGSESWLNQATVPTTKTIRQRGPVLGLLDGSTAHVVGWCRRSRNKKVSSVTREG